MHNVYVIVTTGGCGCHYRWRVRDLHVAVAICLVLLSAVTPAPAARVQFLFTSDQHYGITRPAFRGETNVDAREVNKALVAAINALPALTFPNDAGVGSAEPVGAFDFVAQTGDVANRMELDRGRQIQTAADSWSAFVEDYIQGIALHDARGERTPIFLVPGNHEASNAVGFYKPMVPARDPSALIDIYNRMMTPSTPLTPTTFVYSRDRVHYSRDIGGLHLQFISIWPDSAERAWMAQDLATVSATTPVFVFAHDQIEGESKHFINPTGRHDINAVDRFENLLADEFTDGGVDAPNVSAARTLEAFLRAHRNITAYLHGNSNFNQFYDYVGPDRSIAIHVVRVDSPMKGRFSMADETKLSFQVVTVDTTAMLMTVREVLWNALKMPSPVVWGAASTVSIRPR